MPKYNRIPKKINLEKVCRACLSERGHLREIFSTKLPKMMETCASIKVCEQESLPPYVCVSCFHLIAKFYTFKKKMERSDLILRSFIKKSCKQKDILNIAINEAQIQHDQLDDDSSEEDLPLSEIKRRNDINNCNELDLIRKDSGMKVESVEIEGTAVFSEEPPPLVPIDNNKSISNDDVSDNINSDNSINKLILQSLSNDPPPLVPIKPIINADNILTNVIDDPLEINLECRTCMEQFNSLSALKQHKLTACQQNGLKCIICRKEFRDRKRLIGHLKGHMVTKDYLCNICGKRYPNPSTFRVHMRTHTGERPFKCQVCGKGFVRWAGVVGHMRTHQSHKPYTCETCGKGFKISSNLERHKVLHLDSLPFCCNYCGKTFSQSDNLQLHIRTYHTNERPYLCNICGKGFVSSTRLNRHLWVHSGYKPYPCKSCPKAYSNSNDLKYHTLKHIMNDGNNDNNLVKEKPYSCKICKMRFFHPCRLSKHMKTHERPYICSICNKGFSSNTLLNKHLNSKRTKHFIEEEINNFSEENQILIEYT